MIAEKTWGPDQANADKSWELILTDDERRSISKAVKAAQETGRKLYSLVKDDFPFDRKVLDLVSRISEGVKGGYGFVVLRGLPMSENFAHDGKWITWGISQHIGTIVSQNKGADLIGEVIDRGQVGSKTARGYGSKNKSDLHVDLCDVVGLVCIRQSQARPLSLLANSVYIYHSIMKTRPDLLERLVAGYYWDRFGEQADWEAPTSSQRLPVFSAKDGLISCRYNRVWFEAEHSAKLNDLTAQDIEALNYFDEVALRSTIQVDLSDGDAYFASNLSVLHGRGPDAAEPQSDDQRRLLYRVWLNIPDFRDTADEQAVRWGIGTHGNLGWTYAELEAGKNKKPCAARTHI